MDCILLTVHASEEARHDVELVKQYPRMEKCIIRKHATQADAKKKAAVVDLDNSLIAVGVALIDSTSQDAQFWVSGAESRPLQFKGLQNMTGLLFWQQQRLLESRFRCRASPSRLRLE